MLSLIKFVPMKGREKASDEGSFAADVEEKLSMKTRTSRLSEINGQTSNSQLLYRRYGVAKLTHLDILGLTPENDLAIGNV
jgi:hypothetical protein